MITNKQLVEKYELLLKDNHPIEDFIQLFNDRKKENFKFAYFWKNCLNILKKHYDQEFIENRQPIKNIWDARFLGKALEENRTDIADLIINYRYDYMSFNNHFYRTIITKNLIVLDYLLDKVVELNEAKPPRSSMQKESWNAFLICNLEVNQGDEQRVITEKIWNTARKLNIVQNLQGNFLIHATKNNNLDLVEKLTNGCYAWTDINYENIKDNGLDREVETTFGIACKNNNKEILNYLLTNPSINTKINMPYELCFIKLPEVLEYLFLTHKIDQKFNLSDWLKGNEKYQELINSRDNAEKLNLSLPIREINNKRTNKI